MDKENSSSSKTSKDNYSIEIPNKEKNSKDLDIELESLKKKLEDNKTKSIISEFLTAEILFGEIIIYTFSHGTANINALLISMSIFYVATKSLSLLTLGSRISRHIKKKKLTTAISSLEKEKAMLEVKEENKTKTNNISNNSTKSYNNTLNYQSPPKDTSKTSCKKRVRKK